MQEGESEKVHTVLSTCMRPAEADDEVKLPGALLAQSSVCATNALLIPLVSPLTTRNRVLDTLASRLLESGHLMYETVP